MKSSHSLILIIQITHRGIFIPKFLSIILIFGTFDFIIFKMVLVLLDTKTDARIF